MDKNKIENKINDILKDENDEKCYNLYKNYVNEHREKHAEINVKLLNSCYNKRRLSLAKKIIKELDNLQTKDAYSVFVKNFNFQYTVDMDDEDFNCFNKYINNKKINDSIKNISDEYKKYKKIRKERKITNKTCSNNNITKYDNAVKSADNISKTAKLSAEEIIENIQNKNADLSKEIKKLNEEIEELKDKQIEYDENVKELVKKINIIDKQINHYEDNVKKHEEEKLQQENAKLQKDLDEYKIVNDNLRNREFFEVRAYEKKLAQAIKPYYEHYNKYKGNPLNDDGYTEMLEDILETVLRTLDQNGIKLDK